MSNIEKVETMEVEKVWSTDSYDKIRKMFAPSLSNQEFGLFVGLGKSLGANPFLREIWAVKYGNQDAQIFLGRDFYRRKAQEQKEYNGHQVDAVYAGDDFKMVNGKPEHSYSLQDRGVLLGAYCIVYVNDREPYFVFCDYNEYTTGKSTWKDKPATMIKKVAEAQALRGAFQGVFAGTYDESEDWKVTPIEVDKETERVLSLVEKCETKDELINIRNQVPERHYALINDTISELEKLEVADA